MGWMPINEGDPLYTPVGSKTVIKDTFPPVFASGYPAISRGAEPNDRTIKILVNDMPEPEVVLAQIDYGTDTHYGKTAISGPGYSRRPTIELKALQSKTVYHYRVTLTDPVGNVTVTDDHTFDTGRRPR